MYTHRHTHKKAADRNLSQRKVIKKCLHLNTDNTPEAEIRDESQISERHDIVNMGNFCWYIQNLSEMIGVWKDIGAVNVLLIYEKGARKDLWKGRHEGMTLVGTDVMGKAK